MHAGEAACSTGAVDWPAENERKETGLCLIQPQLEPATDTRGLKGRAGCVWGSYGFVRPGRCENHHCKIPESINLY